MIAVHRQWVERALRKTGLDWKLSRSGKSMSIFRPGHYRSGRQFIPLGAVRLQNDCVDRRIVEGIIGAAGYRIHIKTNWWN